MDEIATLIPKQSELTPVQKKLYAEIVKADRTGKSLMEQGYDRSDIQYSMRLLVDSGFIFKYGIGANTFFTMNKSDEKPKRLNPIVLPEGLQDNHALAFRMGYTETKPAKGKIHKGIMSHEH
jgi:hypothetical protein